MKVRVEVTAEDIANGIQEDPSGCAVYLAARRAGVPVQMIGSVSVICAREPGSTKPARVKLPSVARAFIDAFDLGQPVSPFSFEMEIA